jgi:hypothetical protein
VTVRVLFLALGGNRARAAVEESAQVVAVGGRPVVLVDTLRPWRRMSFDPAVEVVELSTLESTRMPVRLERAVLFTVPRRLFRVVGRGPLRQPARRVSARYETRVAERLHRQVVLPMIRPRWGEGTCPVLCRYLAKGGDLDAIVVLDPASMPYAAGLVAGYRSAGTRPPRLAFGIDHLLSLRDSG